MDKDWIVLLVSAGTDFVIAAGGALTAAMMVQEAVVMPSGPVLIVAVITGAIAFARTVQQGLKNQTKE